MSSAYSSDDGYGDDVSVSHSNSDGGEETPFSPATADPDQESQGSDGAGSDADDYSMSADSDAGKAAGGEEEKGKPTASSARDSAGGSRSDDDDYSASSDGGEERRASRGGGSAKPSQSSKAGSSKQSKSEGSAPSDYSHDDDDHEDDKAEESSISDIASSASLGESPVTNDVSDGLDRDDTSVDYGTAFDMAPASRKASAAAASTKRRSTVKGAKPVANKPTKRIIPRALDHSPLNYSQQKHIEALERTRQQRDCLAAEQIGIPQLSPSKTICRQKVHERKVVVAAVRKPGVTPATRLPPSLRPFKRKPVAARPEAKDGALVAADPDESVPRRRAQPVAHPKQVHVEDVAPTSVVFSWKEPMGMTPQLAESARYRVRISMDRGATYPIDFMTVDKCCEVGNLTPNTMYRLVVLTHFDSDLVVPVELAKKHSSVHFHTRPIPQVLIEPGQRSPLPVPVVRSKRSPLYSTVSMDAWMGK